MTGRFVVFAALALLGSVHALADELTDINNFRQYSDTFASAGQPTLEQLPAVRDAGFERIIYIAWSDQAKALPNEDRLVANLGMDYLHIPVAWDAPTLGDFQMFAAAMQLTPVRKTLLHCQVNFRASAFSFLYRVIHEGVPVETAKRDLNSVWRPNKTWRDWIFEVLAAHKISPQCTGCDWSIPAE
ncbi:MAG: protein tyrosine phosphatase family protein [Woeseia sp.]